MSIRHQVVATETQIITENFLNNSFTRFVSLNRLEGSLPDEIMICKYGSAATTPDSLLNTSAATETQIGITIFSVAFVLP